MTSDTNHRSPLTVDSGHSSLQGVRPSMEDEVLIKENFRLSNSSHLPGLLSFYGVFDGHGGRQAAIYTRDHLFNFLVQELEGGKGPEESLRAAFLQTDNTFIAAARGEEKEEGGEKEEEHMMDKEKPSTSPTSSSPSLPPPILTSPPHSSSLDKDTSGTTAVAILVDHTHHTLYIAHVGDSRAILLSTSSPTVHSLTLDHKADRPDEVERIRAAGGFVVHKRVMGELAISRAIGDMDFKEKGFLFVLADPEVAKRELKEEEDVLVLACDGLYDVMTNDKVGEWVRDGLKEGKGVQELADGITKHAIEKLFTRDNVTVIIVHMKRGGGEGKEDSLAHHAPHHVDHASRHHTSHHHHQPHQQQHTGGGEASARIVPAPVVAGLEEPEAEAVMQDALD